MGNVWVFTLYMGERHPIHAIKISLCLWSGVKSENDYMRHPKYNRRLRNRAYGSTYNMQPFKDTHTKEYHIQIYVIVKINNNRQQAKDTKSKS